MIDKKRGKIELKEKPVKRRGEKTLFLRVLFVSAFLFIINLGGYAFKFGGLSGGITGFSVGDTFIKAYQEISFTARVFLIVQWGVVLVLLLVISVRDKGVKSRKKELEGIDINKVSQKGTDLDVLYKILESKKQVRVSTIAKTFKVKKDTALNWAKMLESSNLATIEYPGFGGEPVLKISAK